MTIIYVVLALAIVYLLWAIAYNLKAIATILIEIGKQYSRIIQLLEQKR